MRSRCVSANMLRFALPCWTESMSSCKTACKGPRERPVTREKPDRPSVGIDQKIVTATSEGLYRGNIYGYVEEGICEWLTDAECQTDCCLLRCNSSLRCGEFILEIVPFWVESMSTRTSLLAIVYSYLVDMTTDSFHRLWDGRIDGQSMQNAR